MAAAGAGVGASLHVDTPAMLASAHVLGAASTQMLSHVIPTVVPPAGLDEVSIRKALELNARAAKLAIHLDAGAWNLAGGAQAIMQSVYTLLGQEADNVSKFSGFGGSASATTGGLHGSGGSTVATIAGLIPNFPPVPSIPDVLIPEIPTVPAVLDAEYISTLINGGAGAEPHLAAAQHWSSVGESLSQVSEFVASAASTLAAAWQSSAADAAHSALNQFHEWLSLAGQGATDLGKDWHVHAAAWKRAQDNIPLPHVVRKTKSDLVQAMSDNDADGGFSTPRVLFYTSEYNGHNATTHVQMADYSSGQPPGPTSPGLSGPPPISSDGPPRVPGTPVPPPGSIHERLTDDPQIQSLTDPKAMMAMMTVMMAGLAGAAGGLGAVKGVGDGLLQPITGIPSQIAQQLSSLAGKGGAIHPAALHSAHGAAAAKKPSGGAGGGVKPAGLGGGARLSTPPPVAFPAAPAGPAARPVAPTASPAGAAAMGAMMPMTPMGAAGRANRKDKPRNKELFPDETAIDTDTAHVPAVLGAIPEPRAHKPAFSHKVVKADS